MKTGKPKIIFSSYDDIKNPTYGGGGAFAVHETAKYLVKNFDVLVITGSYPMAKDETVDGVRYRRIGPASLSAKISQFLFHFLLPFYVLTEEFDLWIESFTPPFSTSFTPLFTKKPVIGLVHMLSGEDMYRKYHIPFYLIENFGLTFYKYFIVLTEHSSRRVRLHNSSAQICIIGNGVHISSQPEQSIDSGHISFLGRIENNQKGLDLLLGAYSKVANKINIPLSIAGSGSYEEQVILSNTIKKYGLNGKVSVIGRVDGVQKDEFLRKTMIGIVPSRYETFSLVTLEMMSCGIPTIIFDIDNFDWIPQDAAIRVQPFNIDALAESIVRLATDNTLRHTVSKQARLTAEKYEWSVVVKKYEEYIMSILQSKNSHE